MNSDQENGAVRDTLIALGIALVVGLVVLFGVYKALVLI